MLLALNQALMRTDHQVLPSRNSHNNPCFSANVIFLMKTSLWLPTSRQWFLSLVSYGIVSLYLFCSTSVHFCSIFSPVFHLKGAMQIHQLWVPLPSPVYSAVAQGERPAGQFPAPRDGLWPREPQASHSGQETVFYTGSHLIFASTLSGKACSCYFPSSSIPVTMQVHKTYHPSDLPNISLFSLCTLKILAPRSHQNFLYFHMRSYHCPNALISLPVPYVLI